MKIAPGILLATSLLLAGTTNVRIYHQAVASPASVQNKQIGVNTTADASLGFKMWFGKDSDGNITQFIAKSQRALFTAVRQDSSFSKVDTAWKYKGDTSFITAQKATRLYFGVEVGTSSRNDSTFSIRDTSKILKTDSANVAGILICKDIRLPDSTRGLILKSSNGTARKYWRLRIDSAGTITADSNGIN